MYSIIQFQSPNKNEKTTIYYRLFYNLANNMRIKYDYFDTTKYTIKFYLKQFKKEK